ncbi:5' exonuclease Apollo [Ananas comosus]|uniref:5' exonuclease Apollo n=1 Tax=Ananas comosus TaxID=4615 RepID=A0A199UNT2_ANACO|nr:5' exonuclease Apollo [Ananas comosus]
MEKGLISVDRWGQESQAYFLTHLHADHTKGLSPQWCRGPLFCSPISAHLLPSKFPGFDPSLIRVLDVGSTQCLSLHSHTAGSQVRVVVTTIDAHHCPGAVMYLFRGEFGCVLYTGDFRWELRSKRAMMGKKTLLEALQGDKVDALYLDNTYCHPSFSFPPREVVAEQVCFCFRVSIFFIGSHTSYECLCTIGMYGSPKKMWVQEPPFLNFTC